jgi:hypothetical protein
MSYRFPFSIGGPFFQGNLVFCLLVFLSPSCAEVEVDDQAYTCASDGDCGAGWSCTEAGVCASSSSSGNGARGSNPGTDQTRGSGDATQSNPQNMASLEDCLTNACTTQIDACFFDSDCAFLAENCAASCEDTSCAENCFSSGTSAISSQLYNCIQSSC